MKNDSKNKSLTSEEDLVRSNLYTFFLSSCNGISIYIPFYAILSSSTSTVWNDYIASWKGLLTIAPTFIVLYGIIQLIFLKNNLKRLHTIDQFNLVLLFFQLFNGTIIKVLMIHLEENSAYDFSRGTVIIIAIIFYIVTINMTATFIYLGKLKMEENKIRKHFLSFFMLLINITFILLTMLLEYTFAFYTLKDKPITLFNVEIMYIVVPIIILLTSTLYLAAHKFDMMEKTTHFSIFFNFSNSFVLGAFMSIFEIISYAVLILVTLAFSIVFSLLLLKIDQFHSFVKMEK